jgi:hypothetical protein
MSARRLLPALIAVAAVTLPAAAPAKTLRISEFKLAPAKLDTLREHWVHHLLRTYPQGTWAPMKMELTNADLKVMGLPPKRFLLGKRFPVPTAVYPDGHMVRLMAGKGGKGGKGGGSTAGSPSTATYAGAGWFGIRPGGWLLTITDDVIGWCSMAHVYGAPGSYQISTAGHCGKTGDVGTVIGVVGDHQVAGTPVPVLVDFGKYSRSTGDAGIGKDWALIAVDPEDQAQVTPTMAFWGGPIGMYTTNGEVVDKDFNVNPNPTLVQQIVHYGHGTGIGGPGVGTPRSGTAITWQPDNFSFFGVITPGDSGSGSNTLTGDAVGDNREAAGINTHIYVDGSLETGLGIMAGTRATQVGATLANGQIVPYPIPTPIPLP